MPDDPKFPTQVEAEFIDDDRDVIAPRPRFDVKAALEKALDGEHAPDVRPGAIARVDETGVEVAGAVEIGSRATLAAYFRRAWTGVKSWGAYFKIGGE